MRINEQYPTSGEGPSVQLRCPHCGREGTFEKLGMKDLVHQNTWFGQRRCPSDQCHGHIFYVQKEDELVTYPPEQLDFATEGIPEGVLAVFREALTCHAHKCSVAAAMMLRRTLEAVCQDQGAEGEDLKTRLGALRSRVVLPQELFEVLDGLRLLDDEVAQVNARAYDHIDEEQIRIGIELTREILQAIYRFKDLLSRLRKLNRSPGA